MQFLIGHLFENTEISSKKEVSSPASGNQSVQLSGWTAKYTSY